MNQFNKPEFLDIFIDRWKELPVLWATKDPISRNKELRKAALESLLPLVRRQVGQNVTTEQLEVKIGTLRGTYRKARNKVFDSMRSGAGAGQVYVPTLWYYSKLTFLDEHLEVRESLSSLPPRRQSVRRRSSLPSSQPDAPSADVPSQQPSILEEDPDLPAWSQV